VSSAVVRAWVATTAYTYVIKPKGVIVMSGTNFILIVVTILTLLFVLVTVMPLVSSF
jgi:hypothetical protein